MPGADDRSVESPQEVLANLPRSRRQRPSARRATPARVAIPAPTPVGPTTAAVQEPEAAARPTRTVPPAGYAAPDARPGSAHPLTQLEELLRTTLRLLRR